MLALGDAQVPRSVTKITDDETSQHTRGTIQVGFLTPRRKVLLLARRRYTQPHQNKTEDVLQQLRKLRDTPLSNIGDTLESDLNFVANAIQAGSANPSLLVAVVQEIEEILQILPDSFGDRFWFDAQMIYEFQQSWNGDTQRLSGTVIPKTGKAWGHESVFVTSTSANERIKSINLIHLPGQDKLSDVDLLTYPFICHELAHNLFYFDDNEFVVRFRRALDNYLGNLRLRGIADQGEAKAKSLKLIQEIDDLWSPTLNHKNWAHEMAMDITALWACGPAYLAAFQDEIEEQSKNPYLIEQRHPPYAVRARALFIASQKLGWDQHSSGIKEVGKKWRQSPWGNGLDNRYIALTDPKLTDACLACALAACESYRLPRCTTSDIERISLMLTRGETPDFGLDLLLAAWLRKEQQDEGSFAAWEQDTLRALVKSLTPLSP